MTGWISLHRAIRKHWLYEEDRKYSRFEAWVDLLLEANHDDEKIMFDGSLITVKRSENLTSLRKLSERWRWSITKVNSFLKILEEDEMITVKKDTKKTVITIVNYDLYQNKDLEKRHRKNAEKTQKENRSKTEKNQKETNNNINKLNNINKDNNYNNPEGFGVVFQSYEQLGFGILNGHKAEQINHWIEIFNPEMVTAAMKIASNANKANMGYLNGILNNWKEKGFKSIQDVGAESKQRNNGGRSKSAGTPNPYQHNDDLPF